MKYWRQLYLEQKMQACEEVGIKKKLTGSMHLRDEMLGGRVLRWNKDTQRVSRVNAIQSFDI